MKKAVKLILCAMCFTLVSNSTYSQSFLKKLEKGLDKVNNELDKANKALNPEKEKTAEPQKTEPQKANTVEPQKEVQKEAVKPVVKEVKETAVNIPKTRGVMSAMDNYYEHDKRQRITPQLRNILQIHKFNCPDFNKTWTDSQLSLGVSIYKGSLGSILTVLFIEVDHASSEYLVSYDEKGDYIDCIKIASISVYGGDRGEGIIEKDEVTAGFFFDGAYYVKYKITPELKFVKIKEWEEE